MNDESATNPGRKGKVLVTIVLIAICIGGVIIYFSFRDQSVSGSIEISFEINDPLRYPDDEPLMDPQTVVWLEDESGKYIQSLLVSDWTAQEGWEVKVKLPDGTKVTKICPLWHTASGWPKDHSKQVVDSVTMATPATGSHKVSIKCTDLKLTAGTYRYLVQTSVAERHTIIATGTITVGSGQTESTATIEYDPEMHKDAGGVLSNVKARHTP